MPPRTRQPRSAPPMDSPFGEETEDISFVKPDAVKDTPKSESKSDNTSAPRYVPGKYKEALEGYYTGLGMLAASFRAEKTAASLLAPYEDQSTKKMTTGAEQCAISIDDWAKVNPRVRSICEKVTTGGVVAAVVTAHAPILMSAASEFGLVAQITSLFKSFKKDAKEQEEQHVNGFVYSNPGAAVA